MTKFWSNQLWNQWKFRVIGFTFLWSMFLFLQFEYNGMVNLAPNYIYNSASMDNLVKCTDSNWLNEMYSIYEPLNNNSFGDYKKINYRDFKQSPSSFNELPIILINDNCLNMTHDKNITDILSMFDLLAFNSIYIHRVYNKNDILIIQRLFELTNDECCDSDAWNKVLHYKRYYIFNQFCWECGCIHTKAKYEVVSASQYKQNELFYVIANKTSTDKITRHQYHHLYGKYLNKFYHQNNGNFMEIGLGCDMGYGPGASASIWVELFNNIHLIEYNEKCVNKHKNMIDRADNEYTVHVGDQSDLLFLEKIKNKYFIEKGFDIVVDDGGHYNKQIIASFLSLWHLVNVNAMYFMEDYGESTNSMAYIDDGQNLTKFGDEKPGTVQYFVKSLFENMYCHIFPYKSCYDIKYIEAMTNICLIGK